MKSTPLVARILLNAMLMALPVAMLSFGALPAVAAGTGGGAAGPEGSGASPTVSSTSPFDLDRLSHDPDRAAMRWRERDGRIGLRLHTGLEVDAAWVVLDEGAAIPMRRIGESSAYRYWEASVGASAGASAENQAGGTDGAGAEPAGPRTYRFRVQAGDEQRLFGAGGLTPAGGHAPVDGLAPADGLVPAAQPWPLSPETAPLVEVPDWAAGAVFYQIFPERFANGDPSNDPPGTVPWGSRPTISNFMGGDLQGVIDRAGYLADLGVQAVWFNPIFDAPSNHKYDTRDYRRIDPHFGDLQTFRNMVDRLHSLGIRVILDGVFNHTGDQFWAFKDVEQRGPDSPYWNWYFIYKWPLTKQPPSYQGWAGYGHMPKLNHGNPEVRRYIYDTVRYWLEQGVDGWRLDVANEVPHELWQEFRQVVKAANPEAYIAGEIWRSGEPWLRGDEFDAVMNYRFREAMLNFFAFRREGPQSFDSRLAQIRADYPGPVFHVLLNLLDSHDTERFFTVTRGDVARMKLAVLFQMTYAGAPIIYYGDEVGMHGIKDPDSRRSFPWDPAQQNQELLEWYRRLIELRRSERVLQVGDVRTLLTDSKQRVYAFARELGGEPGGGAAAGAASAGAPARVSAEASVERPTQVAIVVLNNGDAAAEVTVPWSGPPLRWRDVLTGEVVEAEVLRSAGAVSGDRVGEQAGGIRVRLAPLQGRVLMPVRQAATAPEFHGYRTRGASSRRSLKVGWFGATESHCGAPSFSRKWAGAPGIVSNVTGL